MKKEHFKKHWGDFKLFAGFVQFTFDNERVRANQYFPPKKKPMRREALSPFFCRRFLLPLQKLQSLKAEIANINDFAHVVKIALQLYDFEDFTIVTDCSFYRVFKVSHRWGFRGLHFRHIRFAHWFSKLRKYPHVLRVFKLFHSAEICIRMKWCSDCIEKVKFQETLMRFEVIRMIYAVHVRQRKQPKRMDRVPKLRKYYYYYYYYCCYWRPAPKCTFTSLQQTFKMVRCSEV